MSQFKAVHRHLFGDVYSWAGSFRTVRIAKDGSPFCYPEHIGGQIRALFSNPEYDFWRRSFSSDEFACHAAHFLTELNAIHAFREGNGRTQFAFMGIVSAHVGHPFDLARLNHQAFLKAMIASFYGNEEPLIVQIRAMID